jgi:hypothetical protein
MPCKSYAERMKDAQVMLAGLRERDLTHRGIDEDFILNLEENINSAVEQNGEQQRLKAKLKIQTANVNKTVKNLIDKVAEAKKVVKLDVPQELWKQFGIQDKR